MSKGGDRGGRKPRSPVASLARARGFSVTTPEQLADWTMDDLRAVEQALRLAAAVFEDEARRRFEAVNGE